MTKLERDMRRALRKYHTKPGDLGDQIAAAVKVAEKHLRARRRSGVDPQTTLPCSWCEKIVPTTIEETWSEAYPEGRLSRMCANCISGCAGG